MMVNAQQRLADLRAEHEALIAEANAPQPRSNGIYQRWQHPVVTAAHVPLDWRYDFNPETNPFMMERMGINATFNAGAMKWQGKYVVVVRVEGNDRKSFFAVAESDNGIDGFRFWPKPVVLPQTDDPDTNVYDMRLTQHADGWIYGLFCTERKDRAQPDDLSAATAQCGIARTKDLIAWERLPDLITNSGQQRNVVLHPEFIDGKYALYTRPQDGFISVGSGGGIGWGLTDDMTKAVIDKEIIVDNKVYHTIKEIKNGQGPAPGGHFIAPQGAERVGDVSNVTFSNGWIADEDGKVFIYYASSDTRLHVATSSVAQLVDYCKNTPADPLTSAACVQQRINLIDRNAAYTAGK